MGETMPRRKKEEEGTPWYVWVLLGLLFLVLLKVFRVLPDPPEYLEILAGIGAAVGVVGSFGTLFNAMFGFQKRLSVVETETKTIKEDVAEIRNDVKKIKEKLIIP
jgi:hypothetical protein